MAKNSNFGEVSGDLVTLLAKVQSMTKLADAGMKICEVGEANVFEGAAQDTLEVMAIGLRKMCDDLKDDVNALSKQIKERGVKVEKTETKCEAKGKSIEDVLKDFIDKA